MRKIMLVLQYDGTDFRGWQSQAKGERTVQGVLRKALGELTGESSVVAGAGRTDSGVHALGQVACFQTSSALPPETIRRALNALLPPDVRVASVSEAALSFDPLRAAKGKRYVYLISNAEFASPFADRFSWHVPGALDVRRMRAGGKHFLGLHDFRSFMASGSSVKSTIREITRVSVEEASGGIAFLGIVLPGRFVRLVVEGSGFLRHMVRNLAGTLVEVARGRTAPAQIKEMLAAKNRKAAGPAAPARGLFLERVFY